MPPGSRGPFVAPKTPRGLAQGALDIEPISLCEPRSYIRPPKKHGGVIDVAMSQSKRGCAECLSGLADGRGLTEKQIVAVDQLSP